MTKTQLETKLALLPLLVPVTVENGTNGDDEPIIELTYNTVPGPGVNMIQVALDANEGQMQDVANNLPLLQQDRLAALAILLTPPLPT